MKSATLLILAIFLGACSSNSKSDDAIEYAKTFRAPYETVWRATQQALLNYPMNINNMDTGQLQTLYITGKHRFKPPHKETSVLPSGYQYRINLSIIRGEVASKVIIAKEVRLQKDFFSAPKELTSDGLEEKAIFYRIKREIFIEKLLQRQMEKQQKDQPQPKNI